MKGFLDIVKTNKGLICNSFGTMALKGIGMVFQFFLFPLYITYFGNDEIAGIWLTIISILTWIALFDFGIGQALRNKLTSTFVNKEVEKSRQLISTSYFLSIIVAVGLSLVELVIVKCANFNSLFHIEPELLSNQSFQTGMLWILISATWQMVFNLIQFILYADQKPTLGNITNICPHLILLIVLLFIKLDGKSIGEKFILLCVIYSVATIIPSLCMSVILYSKRYREYTPKYRYASKRQFREIGGVCGTLFWLQIIWVVISRTNEFLITVLTTSEDVIEYQAYNKVFGLIGAFLIVGFLPIWSAVTKAQTEGRYKWIQNIYNNMLKLVALAAVLEIFIILLLPFIMKIWLRENAFPINYTRVLVVYINNIILILHSANTNVSNGMSNFKLQTYVMTVAVVLDIPLSIILTRKIGSWIGVVIANIIVLLVYEVLQIIDTKRKLKLLCNEDKM